MLITFFQKDISLHFDLSSKLETETDKKIIFGTVLKELFDWVDVQQALKSEGLKLSKPINIKMQNEFFSLNTSHAQKSLQQKLKMNSTNKGKRNFAKKFISLSDYMAREVEVSEWKEIEYIPSEDEEEELVPIIDPEGYDIPLNLVMRANF